jgi:hypothetical protein
MKYKVFENMEVESKEKKWGIKRRKPLEYKGRRQTLKKLKG